MRYAVCYTFHSSLQAIRSTLSYLPLSPISPIPRERRKGAGSSLFLPLTNQGIAQTKLAADSGSPLPLYLAISGYAHKGRVRPGAQDAGTSGLTASGATAPLPR